MGVVLDCTRLYIFTGTCEAGYETGILASAKVKILSVRAVRHRRGREVKCALYMLMCDEGGHEQ